MSKDEQALYDIWRKYKQTKDDESRNILAEHYLPLVKYTAERIWAKLPKEVELDDLKSAGVFGLFDAIDSFDLKRGVKFETYCTARVRGSILDELRSLDWVPRLVRTQSHKIENTYRSLEIKYSRPPTEREMAKRMGMTLDEFYDLVRQATAASMISLNTTWNENDDSKMLREIDLLKDKRGKDPTEEIQRKDLKELITKGLSKKERLIMLLYYYEEMTMKEIGMTLNLSESRVSQMHASILLRLRNYLKERKNEFV